MFVPVCNSKMGVRKQNTTRSFTYLVCEAVVNFSRIASGRSFLFLNKNILKNQNVRYMTTYPGSLLKLKILRIAFCPRQVNE